MFFRFCQVKSHPNPKSYVGNISAASFLWGFNPAGRLRWTFTSQEVGPPSGRLADNLVSRPVREGLENGEFMAKKKRKRWWMSYLKYDGIWFHFGPNFRDSRIDIRTYFWRRMKIWLGKIGRHGMFTNWNMVIFIDFRGTKWYEL